VYRPGKGTDALSGDHVAENGLVERMHGWGSR
jgi:hypothetical protein